MNAEANACTSTVPGSWLLSPAQLYSSFGKPVDVLLVKSCSKDQLEAGPSQPDRAGSWMVTAEGRRACPMCGYAILMGLGKGKERKGEEKEKKRKFQTKVRTEGCPRYKSKAKEIS